MNTMMRKADRALLNERNFPAALYLELGQKPIMLSGEQTNLHYTKIDYAQGEIRQEAVFSQGEVELEIRVDRMQSHVVPQMYAMDVVCKVVRGVEQVRSLSIDLLYSFFYNGFQVNRTYVEEMEPGRTGLFAELVRDGQAYTALSILTDNQDVEAAIEETGRNLLMLESDGSTACHQYFILIPQKDKKKDKEEAVRLMITASTLPFSYWQEQQRMYLSRGKVRKVV